MVNLNHKEIVVHRFKKFHSFHSFPINREDLNVVKKGENSVYH